MSKQSPDHHDAELVIKLYDLRRESVMRQSRNTINAWVPKDWEDVLAVTQTSHPMNAAWRQVSTYWEMVYSMGRHGIVHPEYFVENNAEGLLLFAKVAPHLERFRRELSPTAFKNAEWAATETQIGRQRSELFKKRVAAMLEAKR
jgi:hypothetical protein